MLLFANKILINRDAFQQKVRDISSLLGIPPDWLMIVMNFETGGTFSPSIRNTGSTATGLIQFLESTAKSLGTSTAELKEMTNVQQLDYVYKYLKQFGPYKNLVDLYLAVFYPFSIKQDMNYIYPDHVYAANRGLDLDKDGKLEKWEIQERILRDVPAEVKATIKKKIQ